jgi:hypothetical protein
MTEIPPQIRLKDIKDRKGHICQGGHWDVREGPVCGCGAVLEGLPDFLSTPPSDTGWYPNVAETPDDAQAGTVVDPYVDEVDRLEDAGKELTDQSGQPDMTPAVPPVDPTQPYGPGEVERAILDAVQRLERALKHEANLVAAAEQLKVAYELAYARAIRDSDSGAADQRKADAVLACEDQRRAWGDACAIRDAMKSITHTLRATLSGLQSVGRSVGVAYQTTRGTGR